MLPPTMPASSPSVRLAAVPLVVAPSGLKLASQRSSWSDKAQPVPNLDDTLIQYRPQPHTSSVDCTTIAVAADATSYMMRSPGWQGVVWTVMMLPAEHSSAPLVKEEVRGGWQLAHAMAPESWQVRTAVGTHSSSLSEHVSSVSYSHWHVASTVSRQVPVTRVMPDAPSGVFRWSYPYISMSKQIFFLPWASWLLSYRRLVILICRSAPCSSIHRGRKICVASEPMRIAVRATPEPDPPPYAT
mmetsp:Transcript_9703/g.30768  ORF Transcript_9703/g.30768 Transcript_9703/m.30768 type:complete len:243 (+) Transcript_9703:723-1451(+)